MSANCFVLVGYNNVRVYDVAKLRSACHRDYQAKLVLVTEQPKPQDYLSADVILTAPLGEYDTSPALEMVLAALKARDLHPIGILPFSDRGGPLGACLAEHFHLSGARPLEAMVGLDKRRFRALELNDNRRPAGYLPLSSQSVSSLSMLEDAVHKMGGSAFVKPANEGNSRGCMIIRSPSACAEAWAALNPYRSDGIVVEELISDAKEYSWDYVAGRRWLTEKHTTTGRFRAEYQQIVPAPLDGQDASVLDTAGQYMRRLVSTGNGAYHNELFLRPHGVSAVETNMRPAGMHIWDLAALSFKCFNPWHEWLRWAVDGQTHLEWLQPHAYSGIRMLRAPASGVLTTLPDVASLATGLGIRLHQWSFSKMSGSKVSADVTDNSGFIGQIVLTDQCYVTVRSQLQLLAQVIEDQVGVEAKLVR